MARHQRPRRAGLHVRTQRGHRDTRGPILRFAKWLRRQCEFPSRVPVYLLPGPTFTIDGEEAVASFFAPRNRKEEPYIRLATGDYPSLNAELGRDTALK